MSGSPVTRYTGNRDDIGAIGGNITGVGGLDMLSNLGMKLGAYHLFLPFKVTTI